MENSNKMSTDEHLLLDEESHGHYIQITEKPIEDEHWSCMTKLDSFDRNLSSTLSR